MRLIRLKSTIAVSLFLQRFFDYRPLWAPIWYERAESFGYSLRPFGVI